MPSSNGAANAANPVFMRLSATSLSEITRTCPPKTYRTLTRATGCTTAAIQTFSFLRNNGKQIMLHRNLPPVKASAIARLACIPIRLGLGQARPGAGFTRNTLRRNFDQPDHRNRSARRGAGPWPGRAPAHGGKICRELDQDPANGLAENGAEMAQISGQQVRCRGADRGEKDRAVL